MALYEVTRTDEVQPGEFVSATVIAGGTAQARDAVRHLKGATGKNLLAARRDTVADIAILSVYMDEREPLAPELPEDDDSGLWKS